MKALVSMLLLCLVWGCAEAVPPVDLTAEYPPIHVSIVTHNEQPRNPASPAYSEDRKYFMHNRDATVEFARLLHSQGITYNFQSDWDFVLGVLKFDHGSHSTGDKNVLRYLVENLSFEVDPHAHETRYSYADVAHLHAEAGVPVSQLAGGFIALPSEDSKLEHLWKPVQGRQFHCEWRAEAIWGGGTANHLDEQQLWVSGIWKPMDNEHFLTHSEHAPLPHIGGYMRGWDGLRDLLDHQAAGDLDPSMLYTQTIFVPQRELARPEYLDQFRAELSSITSEIAEGRVRWVGLNEVLRIWEEEYDCVPNQFSYR